jgi:hypothetical protein
VRPMARAPWIRLGSASLALLMARLAWLPPV